MATGSKRTNAGARDLGRLPYRFTAAQVLAMVEQGIIEGDVELWNGTLYTMVKGELHNVIVALVADALRAVLPAGYHVREEKSCQYGERSLPEPDVAVARGLLHEYLPHPPQLARLALVVEVSHHSGRADGGTKLRRYAEVGIPVYWLVDAAGRSLAVLGAPRGAGKEARYETRHDYRPGDDVPIVIDGHEVGRVGVADLFPPEARP